MKLLTKSSLLKLVSVLLSTFLWCCNPPQQEVGDLPDQISFNFDIRPILSNNCFVCHGPDSSSRKADLRLDQREYATAHLESGNRAIVPGSPSNSEILKRITAAPEEMMPPLEMNKRLSPREVALISKWIDQGAEWEPYWAYVPVGRPQMPKIAHDQNSEIDFFINKKLNTKNIEPSVLSDKFSLLRRLSYVITGLPPSSKMQKIFAADTSALAYDKMVDSLLNSSHFGEHWARHWMDLVRYADTRGHEFDYVVIGAWRYRDYLIRAFNADVPYDQLVQEHLAGDLLAEPRLNSQEGYNESVIGTAFYCLGEAKHSPVDIKADEAERIDNIIDVTTKTFQGLTVGCAKCHDHKFDPIPTTDYYSLYGIFESTRPSLVPAGLNARKFQLLDSIKDDLQTIRDFITEQVHVDKATDLRPLPAAKNLGREAAVIGDFRNGGLQSWRSSGIAFSNSLGAPIISGNSLVGLQRGKASSQVYGKGLQGTLRSPTFIISHDSLLVMAAGEHSTVRVIIDNFQLIQNPIYGGLRIHPDAEMREYAIDFSMWKGHKAYIELQVGNYGQKKGKGYQDYYIDPEAWLEVAYVYAFDSTGSPSFGAMQPHTTLDQAWISWREGQANAEVVATLDGYFKKKRPRIAGVDQIKVNQANKAREIYDSVYLVGVTDGDAIKSPVFIRGNPQKLSSYQVPHRFLTAVSDTNRVFQGSGSGRLQLAAHMVDPKNPLTARVMANRIWHYVFGRGLVETVDNFGLQGKPPTHPDLLDYLAYKFVEDGWSIKGMIRHMVMSEAFKRSTKPHQKAQELDPDNTLWHHYPVRRMDAESIRDTMLATSGQLDTALYGPPIPIFLTPFLKGRGRPAVSGPLDGQGRRSIYQRVMRNFLSPMMLAFDMPVPFSTFGRRNTSNVPAQSLTLLNDPFVLEQAKHWAYQVMASNKSFEDCIVEIYIKAFGRLPKEHELQQAQEFFEKQKGLLKDTEIENLELELWENYCHSVFNMKEFIYLI